MNDTEAESSLERTAYHEAGHAVVGYALGGIVESVQLGGEADDGLPERFGDCRIAWPAVSGGRWPLSWQRQREVLTVLAGPVAEMVYSQQPYHPAVFGPWQEDWARADALARPGVPDSRQRLRLLEQLTVSLLEPVRSDRLWAAIAAVADELLAHELLEQDQLAEILDFWMQRP